MPRVTCYCYDCRYYDENGDWCGKDFIAVMNERKTVPEKLPVCQDYEEREEDDE